MKLYIYLQTLSYMISLYTEIKLVRVMEYYRRSAKFKIFYKTLELSCVHFVCASAHICPQITVCQKRSITSTLC